MYSFLTVFCLCLFRYRTWVQNTTQGDAFLPFPGQLTTVVTCTVTPVAVVPGMSHFWALPIFILKKRRKINLVWLQSTMFSIKNNPTHPNLVKGEPSGWIERCSDEPGIQQSKSQQQEPWPPWPVSNPAIPCPRRKYRVPPNHGNHAMRSKSQF